MRILRVAMVLECNGMTKGIGGQLPCSAMNFFANSAFA